MSDLSIPNRRYIEKFLEKQDWVVTHPELDHLFKNRNYRGHISIRHHRIWSHDRSIRDRLNYIWNLCSNVVAANIIRDLLLVARDLDQDHDEAWWVEYNNCMSIGARLSRKLEIGASQEDRIARSETYYNNQKN